MGSFRSATERAIKAGFDGIEIHGGYGYLNEARGRQACTVELRHVSMKARSDADVKRLG
nr:hypothetical protein [Marinicella sp. W31]MDC2875521.1 hypothetical protein [Marinicella sp. W31]